MNDRLIKQNGQVFTSGNIVNGMLDYCGYKGTAILNKHVIDNSCGNGSFLCAVVHRYCSEYFKTNKEINILRNELATYIHGIEIDKKAYESCIFNLNVVVNDFGLYDIEWDILNDDALKVTKFDGIIDFVIGNPPYVRVHNLAENYNEVKRFAFATGGMTDLYLVFFELGFRMLNERGRLCYITPSSWLKSIAASNMRKYIFNNRNLVGLIDFGHCQVFENAMAYVIISFFDKSLNSSEFDYYHYDEKKKKKVLIDRISLQEIYIGNCFYLGTKTELNEIRKIKGSIYRKKAVVKNGYATLADKVFILNVPFNTFTIPVIKGSTGKWHKGFFPYNEAGKPLSKDCIFSQKDVSEYLNSKKQELLKNKKEEENPCWYLYGRTQALKDTFEDKISINSIIKDISSIKLNKVPKGSGIYSGLYILTDVEYNVIEHIIKSKEFISYLRILQKYKSGGYYTYNTKDLEDFLNYKLTKNERASNRIPFE